MIEIGIASPLYNGRSQWRVRLQKDGKRVQIGNFDSEREAYAAYLRAKEREKV